MAWKDNIKNAVFEIVTGDGISYFPKWLNATKELEFNISEFNFVGVDGSLVDRKTSKGRVFPLEFYFDGADNIDMANAFEISSRNTKRWTLKHPYYGNIKCQPVKLKQDNTKHNASKFNITVIETLLEGYPQAVAVPLDQIVSLQEDTNEFLAQGFANNGEFDANELEAITLQQSSVFSGIINDPDELNEFQALVDDALNTITNAESSALDVIRSMQKYISYPATITQTVAARYGTFKESIDALIRNIQGVDASIRNLATKNEFEAVTGSLLAASYVAVSSNITDDYNTREDIISQQLLLMQDYENYLTILDENQTERSDTPESYTPDFDALNALNALYSLAVSNLFSLVFEALQTRIFVVDMDSNPIILTHKFYGLDVFDVNLDSFIKINNLTADEIFIIKKGREVIYYT